MPRLASAGRSAIDPDRSRAAHARRRPRDRRRTPATESSFGALLPRSSFSLDGGGSGSCEVSALYSMTDLTDGTLDGARIERWTGGLSWVPSAPWRHELNYRYSTVDRSGSKGGTHAIAARVQWFPF